MSNPVSKDQFKPDKRQEPSRSYELVRNYSPTQQYVPVAAESEDSAPSTGIPLKHRLWVIWRNLPAIAVFVGVCTYTTGLVSRGLTPIYDATATIDVDRRAPTSVVGQETTNAATPVDTEQFLNTQVRLIQSDSVLKPVVESFKITRAPGTVGLPSLKISRPINTFLILINYRSPDPKRAAKFANAVAASYIEQSYNIRFRASASLSSFMTRQIEELRTKMEHSSMALAAFEKDLNMIRPEETNGIVSARLLQLNTEYTSAQGERVRKEAAVQSLKSGSLVDAEVATQGDSLRRLVDRLGEAKEHFADVDRQYGDRHPEYKKAQERVKALTSELEQAKVNVVGRAESEYKQALNREAILKQQVSDTKAEFDRLNSKTFQYENLRREAEADRKIYEELANRIKEASINSGFQNSSIRLADPAVPAPVPIYPNVSRNIQLAFLLSLVLAVGTSLAADSMNPTLRTPEDVERILGAHVVGILPRIKRWDCGWLAAPAADSDGLTSKANRSKSAALMNSYQNGIRTLRNNVTLGDFGRPIHSVLVTSATPAEGKTTTALHLAISHAQQKRKTLLIDCDLRRPAVRGMLRLPNSVGLSYALADESGWRDQLSKNCGERYLDVLLAGTASRRHADLIGHYLPHILRDAASDYDLIVIDAPPLLGFPEPLQLATTVDGVVVVTLAGKTDHRAVMLALNSLRRLRANTVGIVLNQMRRRSVMDSYVYCGHYETV
jgi:succinoglycan biosynthesis transport protein ExoP